MKERRYRNKEAKIEGRKEEGIEGKGVEKMRMMRKRESSACDRNYVPLEESSSKEFTTNSFFSESGQHQLHQSWEDGHF